MNQVHMLLGMLDQAFDRKAWHGTNLRGSVRGVNARAAARRPGKGRHNIWEIVVHCAYWKYTVRRHILGEKQGSFPVAGSNWFSRPERGSGGDAAWRSDIALLAEMHHTLRGAVAGLTDADLGRVPDRTRYDIGGLVMGAASHDLYHAGQIQLIKKLVGRG